MILISKNLVFLRKKLELKQSELALKLDLKDTTYAHYETGKSSPTLETVKKMADFFKVTVDDLLSRDFSEGNVSIVREDSPVYGKQHGAIPLVNSEAFAGISNGVFKIQEKDIQAYYVVPDFKNITFMMRVRGDSMYPKYKAGDVIACRIIDHKTFIQWNKVHVVASRDQGILIKRLRKSTNPDNLLCVSDNPEYDPFEIPISETDGIALVIGLIRLE